MCLVGMVLTNKPFNAFGLLETMRKAMNPQRGFTAKEIGKNLFSFQFRSTADMLGVLSREPWHFDKNIILLKELGGGVTFTTATFWVRIYDLPLSARSVKAVTQLGNFIGELVELDLTSLEWVSHSVRLKTRVDFRKPLRKGTLLEVREAEKVWVEFKYEMLPSFCYLCGLLGHMRWECDLAEWGEDLDAIPEEKLPFGEWMRASPMRKATITTEEGKKPADNSLRRKLFDEFTQKMRSEKEKEGTGKPVRGGCELEETQEMKRVREHLASMKVQKNNKGGGEESKECKMEESKFSPPPPKKMNHTEYSALTNTILKSYTSTPPLINLPQPPTTSINAPPPPPPPPPPQADRI
ncbi:hypothetical protein ACS0TY_030493 [Phlomoides rotata]